MKRADRKIKEILQDDSVKLDESAIKKIDILMEKLPEKEISVKRTHEHVYAWKVVFAMLAALVILPNIHPSIAMAMYEIPLVGKMFEVVTIRDYEYQDETHEAAIKQPEIVMDGDNVEGVAKLNEESSKFVEQIICEFQSSVEEEGYQATYLDYEVLCNSEKWFTLKIYTTEVMASSDENVKIYHIDKSTGQMVQLGDLFGDDDYINAISNCIYEQMSTELENPGDDTISYWIEDDKEDQGHIIDQEQNFYFNEKEELVIVYDEYEVAPGFMGCPEFTIPVQVYEKYLK